MIDGQIYALEIVCKVQMAPPSHPFNLDHGLQTSALEHESHSLIYLLNALGKYECKRFTGMIRNWTTCNGVATEVPPGSEAWESGNERDFGINQIEYDWKKMG